jgi:hypothetical protein
VSERERESYVNQVMHLSFVAGQPSLVPAQRVPGANRILGHLPEISLHACSVETDSTELITTGLIVSESVRTLGQSNLGREPLVWAVSSYESRHQMPRERACAQSEYQSRYPTAMQG